MENKNINIPEDDELQAQVAKLQEEINRIQELTKQRAEEAARAKEANEGVKNFASLKDELAYVQQGLMEIMKKIVNEKDTALAASMSASRFAGQSYRINTTYFSDIDDINEEALAAALEPFTNPRRVTLLKALFARELTPSEISQKTGLVGGQLYHHLSGLETAGLIEKKKDRYQVTANAQGILISLISALGEQNLVNYEHTEQISREDTEKSDGEQKIKDEENKDRFNDVMKETKDILKEIKGNFKTGMKGFKKDMKTLQKDLNIDLSSLKNIDFKEIGSRVESGTRNFAAKVERGAAKMEQKVEQSAKKFEAKVKDGKFYRSGSGYTWEGKSNEQGEFYQDDRVYNIHKKVYASEYSNFYDTQLEETEIGRNAIAYINDGSYVIYKQVDFDAIINTFTAVAASNTMGGRIQIRVDDVDGQLLGTCAVGSTMSWKSFEEFSCPVTGVQGKRDLYLVFRGEGKGLFNLLSFRFSNQLPKDEQSEDIAPEADTANESENIPADTTLDGGILAANYARSRNVEDYSTQNGTEFVVAKEGTAYLSYGEIDFTDNLDTLQVIASCEGEGGTVELFLDGKIEMKIGEFQITSTSTESISKGEFRQFDCEIEPTTGEHILSFSFANKSDIALHSFRAVESKKSGAFNYDPVVLKYGKIPIEPEFPAEPETEIPPIPEMPIAPETPEVSFEAPATPEAPTVNPFASGAEDTAE